MIAIITFLLVFIAVGTWFLHAQLQTMHEANLEIRDEVRSIRRVVVSEIDEEPEREWIPTDSPYLS